MTVKERTGRKRYVHFINPSTPKLRYIVQKVEGARVVNYRGITAVAVKHTQLPRLREIAGESGASIDMVSGTLSALRRKISQVK